MPFKDRQRQRAYMREYMRKHRRKHQQLHMELERLLKDPKLERLIRREYGSLYNLLPKRKRRRK